MHSRQALAAPILCAALLLTACGSLRATPPSVSPLTSAEIEAQAAMDLENNRLHWLAAFPDVEIPDVQRVRFIDWREWPDVMASCLTEAGFPTVPAGGGIPTTPPSGQEQPYALAAYSCTAQYPVNPRQTKALDDDQLRYLYEYYTLEAMPCMRELGFDDFSPPPSLQTFRDDYNTSRSWTPFTEASNGTPLDLWAEIEETCPQVPDALYG
jgi:hypothetical protein